MDKPEDGGGMAGEERLVVGGNDDGGAEAVHLLEELHETGGLDIIEIAGGFVGQEEAGTNDDGPGNGDALLLPAGELGRAGMGPFGESDPAQHFGDVGADLAFRAAGEAERQSHIVVGGEMREQAEFLEDDSDAPAQGGQCATRLGRDIGTEQCQAAPGWAEREIQQPEQAGLAGSRGAEQPAEAALGNGESDIPQHLGGAVAQPNFLESNHVPLI